MEFWNFSQNYQFETRVDYVRPSRIITSILRCSSNFKVLIFNILGIKCNEMQNELYYFSLCLSPCQRLSAVHGAVYAMQQAFNEVAPMCVDVFHRIPKPNNVA